MRVDDSAAAIDRHARHVEGLTDFLRKEYYRRMGVYCNGAAKEDEMLLKFWRDHVSDKCRREREDEKLQRKAKGNIEREEAMQKLAKKDPAAARRKQLELSTKEEKRLEA